MDTYAALRMYEVGRISVIPRLLTIAQVFPDNSHLTLIPKSVARNLLLPTLP